MKIYVIRSRCYGVASFYFSLVLLFPLGELLNVCSAFATLFGSCFWSWPFLFPTNTHSHIQLSFFLSLVLLLPFISILFHPSWSLSLSSSLLSPALPCRVPIPLRIQNPCRQNIGNALTAHRSLSLSHLSVYNFTHISGSIRNNIMNVSCSNVELATYSISSGRDPFHRN